MDIDLKDEFTHSNEQRLALERLRKQQLAKRLHVTDFYRFLDFFQEYQHQKINSRTKYNGLFEISPSCQIKTKIFSKTVKSSGPAIQKCSHRATGSISGKVKSERIYFKIEELNLKTVDKPNTQKGYEYGSSVIPIAKELEGLLKFQDCRCFKLLGFVDEAKVARHLSMSNVDVMLPVLDNLAHLKAFTSLIRHLLSTRKVGLARLVIRNNSGPKLVTMIPREISARQGRYCFYLSQLPTVEDVRQFRFSSLQSSNATQRGVVKEFVSKMQLDSGGNRLDLDRLVMPQTHLLNQRILQESIADSRENAEPNPNRRLRGKYQGGPAETFWDNELSQQLQIEEQMREGLGQMETKIQDSFDLVENPETVQKANKKYWCDVLKEQEKVAEEEQMIQKMKDHRRETVPDEVSRNYAISDFNAMITFRGEDLVDKAVTQMKSIILDIVKGSLSGSHFAKALECIKALRRGCVSEEEADSFNGFLAKIKQIAKKEKSFFSFFRSLKENGISLISKDEVAREGVSKEEAERYFQDSEDEEEDGQRERKEQDDEDLLRMMDELE